MADDKPAKVEFVHDAHYKFSQINTKVNGQGPDQGPLSVKADDFAKALHGTYKKSAHGHNTINPDEFVKSRDEIRVANPAQNPGDAAMAKARDQALVAKHTYLDKDNNRTISIPEMVLEAKAGLQYKQLQALKANNAEPDKIQHAKDDHTKTLEQWHGKRQELGLEKPRPEASSQAKASPANSSPDHKHGVAASSVTRQNVASAEAAKTQR